MKLNHCIANSMPKCGHNTYLNKLFLFFTVIQSFKLNISLIK